MTFKEIIDLISKKFGEDIDIVIYPDLSGHVKTSYSYRKHQKLLLSWESYEDLIASLVE